MHPRTPAAGEHLVVEAQVPLGHPRRGEAPRASRRHSSGSAGRPPPPRASSSSSAGCQQPGAAVLDQLGQAPRAGTRPPGCPGPGTRRPRCRRAPPSAAGRARRAQWRPGRRAPARDGADPAHPPPSTCGATSSRQNRTSGLSSSTSGRRGPPAGGTARPARPAPVAPAGGQPRRDVLALVARDPAQDDQVVALVTAGRRSASTASGVDRCTCPTRVPAAPAAPGELGERHPVDPQRAAAVEVAVELRVLAQVPVQGVQHRRAAPGRSRRAWWPARPPPRGRAPGRCRRGCAAPAPPRCRWAGRDAAHLVVRPLQGRELAVGEDRDPVVDRQRAGVDRGEHHPHAEPAQLGHEGRDHVLDPAVARRRHRQPGTGVHQHRHRHTGTVPVPPVDNPGMGLAW